VRLTRARQGAVERLLWSRDSRVVARLTEHLPEARVIELADSGWCVIASAEKLTEDLVARVADGTGCGMADVDLSLPLDERYVVALGHAVQVSGLGDRIGMGGTPEIASRKVMSLFFVCKEHHVEFQPIVDLQTMKAHEWECLFRLSPGMGTETIGSVVEAALAAKRPVDFDTFVVDATLTRIAQVVEPGPAGRRMRFGVNFLPASLLAPVFEADALAEMVRRAGLSPRQIIVECTEQQAIHDVPRLKRQVKALRHLGFGFAIDDAGAGYASFTVIAALEPSIIKIDREIVAGIGNKDAEAKKALVEAFVSFSRRIDAQIIAEGIENRRDLLALQDREVDFGQGYLLGRSAVTPLQPKRIRNVDDLTLVISSVGAWDGAASPSVASSE
jgi:EAL domain-containing protein (putative c-di-GMP-specific phosphodiesterase class I)